MPSAVKKQKVTGYIPAWEFSDRLRKIRTDFGYEQREFAALLDVKAPTYSAYESGRTLPRSRDLTSFAARVEMLTGVPAAWLLGVDIAPSGPSAVGRTGLEPVTDGL